MGEFQYKYPRPALTVDIVLFSVRQKSLQVLLIKRKGEPFKNWWALPGGFIELDETLEDAACRELKEETGVENVYIEQLYTFGDIGRDPRERVVTVAFLALISGDDVVNYEGGDDATHVSWLSVDHLPVLAFDHADIISYALYRLRNMLEYSNVAFKLIPQEFTLSDIQHIYEIILGIKIDKRNFRRRILKADIIESTSKLRRGEGRPARLYRYKPETVKKIKNRHLLP